MLHCKQVGQNRQLVRVITEEHLTLSILV